jgi:hypothetical protein
MNWYFVIPIGDITQQMINCSTSYSHKEVRRIWINGTIFKSEYGILKVEESIFNTVTYFDHLQARDAADMREFIAQNEAPGV